MTADKSTYIEYLNSGISWDGKQLGRRSRLCDDLSFRRYLTMKFSPGEPLTDRQIRRLIAEPKFNELLDRAICSSFAKLDDWLESNRHVAPENIQYDRWDWPEDPSTAALIEIWVARFKVFEDLVANEDFKQFLLEREQRRPWYIKLLKWGEKINLPKPEQVAPKESGMGAVLREAYRPLMQSIMYVVPVAVGAHFVADHVIERQREVQSLQPIIFKADPAPGGDKPFESQIALLTANVRALNSSTEKLEDNFVQLQNEIAKTAGTIEVIKNKVFDPNGGLPTKVTLGLDPSLSSPLTNAAQLLAPPRDVTVRLGNAQLSSIGPPIETNQNKNRSNNRNEGESIFSGLRLSLQQSDLNVHQGAFPIETGVPKAPFLLEFEQGGDIKSLSGRLGDARWNQAQLKLCTYSSPYKFMLTEASPLPQGSGDTSPGCTEDGGSQILTITKTPQYVENLNAYLNLDMASNKKYFLFGGRRVVIQVAPARSPE